MIEIGVMQYKDGNKYDGKWIDDKRDGRGTLYFTNGDRYSGEWKDDKINGQGIIRSLKK